eukprot:TRINITY_DN169_c0_g3_i2.p1 TRINITY_DN169_c0_g3~~TRINITY_DN169_c0_g3_i2.p1  ORF type:complete len:103 (-),score=18.78 TRINITY_DN169_c0_g3_i2:81-389(-)
MLSRSSRSLLSVLVLVVAIGSAACVPIDIAPHIDSTLRLRHSCTNDNALQPFVSVTVVMGTSSNVECPAGYIKNPQDLNQVFPLCFHSMFSLSMNYISYLLS